MKPRLAGLIVGFGLAALAASVSAQVRYTDDTGGVHWAQSEQQIPERYRGRVETRLPALPPASPPAEDRRVPDRAKADSRRLDLRSVDQPAAGIAEPPPAEPEPWQPPASPPLPRPRMVPLISPSPW